jgi:hypothetical protein
MGTLSRIGHPPLFCPTFRDGNVIGHPTGGRDRRATWSAKGRGSGASILESLLGRRVGVCSEVAVSLGHESAKPPGQRWCRILKSPRCCRTRICGTSRRCGGSFAEQVPRNVEKCEAPTLLWERLKIRPDENLDGLFAGINLDTNRRVAEIDLVPSSVRSSNDGVGHCRLALRDRGKLRDHQLVRHFELAASRTTGALIGLFKNAADDRRQEDHHADKHQAGNYLFAQGDSERSTALIEFGGPHSSNPERPGARLIARVNRCNYVFHEQ